MKRDGVIRLQTSTYGQALKRLGSGSKSHLSWLLQFSRKDLGKLGPEERLRIREEVGLLCQMSVVGEKTIQMHKDATLKKLSLTCWFLIEEFQGTLKTLFQQLFENQMVRLPKVTIGHSFIKIEPFSVSPHTYKTIAASPVMPWAKSYEEFFNQKGEFKGPRFIHQRAMSEEAAFLEQVATALSDAGDLLTSCCEEQCRRLFVKADKRKIFCSPNCKARQGMRKSRKRQGKPGRPQGTTKALANVTPSTKRRKHEKGKKENARYN